jgi:hypothetical protein
MRSAGAKQSQRSVEAKIAQFAKTAVEAVDSARSRMAEEQVREADHKTGEPLSSVSRAKQ